MLDWAYSSVPDRDGKLPESPVGLVGLPLNAETAPSNLIDLDVTHIAEGHFGYLPTFSSLSCGKGALVQLLHLANTRRTFCVPF